MKTHLLCQHSRMWPVCGVTLGGYKVPDRYLMSDPEQVTCGNCLRYHYNSEKTMPHVIPCDTRRFHFGSPNHSGHFHPVGRKEFHGDHHRTNPEAWRSDKPIWSARLLVGFNVKDKPKWEMDDLVKIVRKVRKKQVPSPAASFVYQKGIYKHAFNNKIITEDGAQVFILNLADWNVSPANFKKQIIELAEVIADKLKQEEVIVEFQLSGISKSTVGVRA